MSCNGMLDLTRMECRLPHQMSAPNSIPAWLCDHLQRRRLTPCSWSLWPAVLRDPKHLDDGRPSPLVRLSANLVIFTVRDLAVWALETYTLQLPVQRLPGVELHSVIVEVDESTGRAKQAFRLSIAR